ncbi:MAG: RagB/SusD family nutrient uptake outer membrane protein [Odoribacter splanchnicus]
MKKYIYILLGLTISLASCESWLEVKMKDKILENVLFENVEGYTTALNGIYAELNSSEIYGRNLSVGAIDVMAQYYDVLSAKNHNMQVFGKYDFGQSSYKDMFSAVWTKMYNLLANVNLLIENCNKADAPVTGKIKELIMGEAYALRAMLHFDLLRLYGPCYNEDNKGIKVMPYMDASDRAIRPMLSAEEILNRVIADFKSALGSLENADPVIEEGPKNEASLEDVNNEWNYRQYRLNYYAVKALLARAYLWGGQKDLASKEALDVVKVAEEPWFPFTSKGEVLSDKSPNRIFSTEVLFALYNTSRKDMYTSLFAKELGVAARLTFFGDYINGRLQTFYGDENDIRYYSWKSDMVDTVQVLYTTQFQPNDDPKNQYMVPLVRMTEMYLLLAECAEKDSDAQDYINKIRSERNALNVTIQDGNRDEHIAKEFAREMIGCGQLFLFYKRKAMTSIPDGHSENTQMDMPLVNYTWVIPDSEIEARPNF